MRLERGVDGDLEGHRIADCVLGAVGVPSGVGMDAGFEVHGFLTRREARWFLAGGIPADLHPVGQPKSRVDRYHVESLRPWHAIKQRGRDKQPERKVRTGRVELVAVGPLDGFAETWQKERDVVAPDGTWLSVHKEWWAGPIIQIGCVEIGGHQWATVCIDLVRMPRGEELDALRRWRPHITRRGEPGGFPTWLGQRAATLRRAA